MLLPDNMYGIDSDDDRYFCFYKNSIYFSFNVSKETLDSIIENENAAYTKKVEKIIKRSEVNYAY